MDGRARVCGKEEGGRAQAERRMEGKAALHGRAQGGGGACMYERGAHFLGRKAMPISSSAQTQ